MGGARTHSLSPLPPPVGDTPGPFGSCRRGGTFFDLYFGLIFFLDQHFFWVRRGGNPLTPLDSSRMDPSPRVLKTSLPRRSSTSSTFYALNFVTFFVALSGLYYPLPGGVPPLPAPGGGGL